MPDSNFYYKNNRLQQLRGFCHTMRYGTLSKAAKVMGLTHATVSLQIKTLEDDLKIRLFERVGARLVPTKIAYILMDEASQHIEAIDTVLERVQKIDDKQEKKTLVISGNHATLNYLYPTLVKDYLEKYPDIHVKIIHYEQVEGMKALAEGKIDVYMLPRRLQRPFGSEIRYEPLFFFKPVLLTLPDHPLAGKQNLTIEEIARYECIAPPPEMTVVPGLYERLLHYKKAQHFRLTFENFEITKKYVEAGIAVVITMDILCELGDRLVPTSVSHIFPSADYGSLTIKGRDIHPCANDFLEIARKYKGRIL
jgi:LysR family transcriptional regulator, cys regulon transcriptional activator